MCFTNVQELKEAGKIKVLAEIELNESDSEKRESQIFGHGLKFFETAQ